MPKPIPLTPELVEAPQRTPRAATAARGVTEAPKPPKVPQVPLQVRLPRSDVKAIKIAAAEREQTISEFMRACFHAYMKSGTHD